MSSFPPTQEVKVLSTYYMQGSVLGAAAALRRLFFLFGAGLGLSSDASSLACETELEERYKLDVSQSFSTFPLGPQLTLAPLPVLVQQ